MYYLKFIREARWIAGWSKDKGTTYHFGICSTGQNGAYVPSITKSEEANIREFFLQYGVEQNAKHDLWWTYEKIEERSECDPFNTQNTFNAGYTFEISAKAYKLICGS